MLEKFSSFFAPKMQMLRQFDQKSEKNKRFFYYTTYTLLFSLVASAVFSWFYMNGKSFIWDNDGLNQHFNALNYFGIYCRKIISSFLSTGKFVLPMWEFNVGYGADIITTFHYYIIGDPLGLLSIFVPSTKTELLYNTLIIIRLYLSGFAFSIYCRKMGRGRFPTLCAAFTYAFCGYALYASVRHPFFVNPMIYLPLILLGAEKILAKGKPYTFIIWVFISAASNFYFFYMIATMTVIYVLIRMFFMYKGSRIRSMTVNLLKFAGFSVIGVLMSCVVFLPNILILLFSQRMNVNLEFNPLFTVRYYQRFLSTFITTENIGSWNVMGYSAISFAAVVLLFTVKRKYKELKTGFIVLTLFLLIPAAGHVIHGFSYVSNRWLWSYSFVIAMILATMIPVMFKATRKQLAILSFFVTLYLSVCLLLKYARSEAFFASFAILAVAVVFIFGIHIWQLRSNGLNKFGKAFSRAGVLVLVLVGIILQAGFNYSYNYGDYVKEFHDSGKGLFDLGNTGARAVSRMYDESFFRFDANKYPEVKIINNSALVNEVNSTSFFYSLADSNIAQFMHETAFDITNECIYDGTDNRAVLGTLASSKYFVIEPDYQAYLPFGYSNNVYSHPPSRKAIYEYLVYENDYALPLGYTYSSFLTRSDYEKLSHLQKQQAMLEAAVLDDSISGLSEATGYKPTESNVPYIVKCKGGSPSNTESDDTAVEDGDTENNTNTKNAETNPENNEVGLEEANLENDNIEVNLDNTETNSKNSPITYTDGKFTVTKKNSKATLVFQGLDNSETYLYFKNMHFTPMNPLDTYSDKELEEMSVYDRNVLLSKHEFWTPSTTGTYKVKTGNISKPVEVRTPKNIWYMGKHDYLTNLCYSKNARTEIIITFENIGEYTFDDMQILCQPMDNYPQQIDALREDVLENINIGTNSVSGTISLDTAKLLCLSIPYSSGWTAYVNGDKTELLRTNTMYSGLLLSPGEHKIDLQYKTVGIDLGFILSCVGFVLFIGLIVFLYFFDKKIQKINLK
jgi:Bacterial membrane protein YfhO.